MRELLIGDWKTKGWAFALALLLWYYASQQVLLTNVLRVPLQLDSPSDVHVKVEQPASMTVGVKVRGRRTTVEGLTGEQLRVVVPVQRPKESVRKYQVELTEKLVQRLPPGVEVSSCDPAAVELEVSRMGSRKLPVLVPTKEALGSPAPGYEVASISPYPSSVEVSGPLTTLEQAKGIPVSLSSPLVTPMDRGAVFRPSSLAEELEGVPVRPLSRVSLYIDIVPKVTIDQRSLTVAVELSAPAGYGYQAQLAPGSETVELRVEGPADRIQTLTKADVSVVASVSGLRPSPTQHPVTARVWLPPGFKLVGAPPLVTVDVKERPTAPAPTQ